MAIKVRKQAAASVETPPDTHVQFFVDTDGLPKLKDSLDVVTDAAQAGQVTLSEQLTDPPAVADKVKLYSKDVGGIAEFFARDDQGNVIQITSGGELSVPQPTIEPSAWVTEMGSARINITAPGTYTVIPSPPAGKLRMVIDGPNGGYLSSAPANQAAPCGLLLWASNGVGMGPVFAGTFDVAVAAQGRVLTQIGITEFSMSGGEYGAFYLAPGESVAVTVSNFASGTTKVVGRATWIDFDATDVTFVRLTFPTVGVPQLVIPPVPVGKIAAMYFPGGALTLRDVSQSNYSAFFNNPDSNLHVWNAIYTDPGGGSITSTGFYGLGAVSYGYSQLFQYYAMVLVEGQSLSVELNSGDTVPSTPPYMWAMYKLYDSV